MKKAILTFDDGPSENFSKLLNFLLKNKYKAIFFCEGKNLEKKIHEKDLIKAIKLGYLIGNHSYSHPNFSTISSRKGREEILKTDKIISELYKKAKIKQKIKLFRFPFFNEGGINFFKYQKFLKKLGYKNPFHQRALFYFPKSVKKNFFYFLLQGLYRGKFDVYTDLATRDWDKEITFGEMKKILKKLKPGEVINLHDQSHTLETSTKKICNYLHSKNLI